MEEMKIDQKQLEQLKRLEEAKRDSVWKEKLNKVKTADEYLKLYDEKGIYVSDDEAAGIRASFAKAPVGEVSDDELDNVAGGFIQIKIDLCQGVYVRFLCDGCGHQKILETRYYPGGWGTGEDIVSCDKGCFDRMERQFFDPSYSGV